MAQPVAAADGSPWQGEGCQGGPRGGGVLEPFGCFNVLCSHEEGVAIFGTYVMRLGAQLFFTPCRGFHDVARLFLCRALACHRFPS